MNSEFNIAPVLLKVLTFFFTASNQIVKDLRKPPDIVKYRKCLQASKLVSDIPPTARLQRLELAGKFRLIATRVAVDAIG